MDLFQKYKGIREELDEQAHYEGSLSPLTVRLPESLLSKLDFIKDQTKQSRQAVLLDLLSDSINSAFLGCMSGAGYTSTQALQLNAKFEGYSCIKNPDEIDYLQSLVTRKLIDQVVVDDWLTGNYTKLELAQKHDLDKGQYEAVGIADGNGEVF